MRFKFPSTLSAKCRAFWFVFAGIVLLTVPLRAELPSIRLDRIQPLGLGIGTNVEIEVIGRDFEEVKSLSFDHSGLSAEFIKPNHFKVSAKTDLPVGTYELRAVGKYGVSNPRILSVTEGFQDVPEIEPNNEATQAQRVVINSAINGTSDGNGQDLFTFAVKQGQRVTVDCQAMKLASLLDANLILTGPGGQILGASGDYHGRDPFLDFVAPVEGDYTVTINDLIFRGGLPYRLLISSLPQVENVFPPVVQEGQSVQLTASGRNLTGQAPNPFPELEQLPFRVNVPSDLSKLRQFTFVEHPLDHSVAPTAATFMLSGYQTRVSVAGSTIRGALHPATLLVTDQSITIDSEPNDSRMQTQKLKLPAVVAGRFDKPRDADWFEVSIPEGAGGEYGFEVYSERIAGQADPYVGVYDVQGNSIGEHDDYGPRMNAFDGHIRDPYGKFNLQEKRTYQIVVQDRYGRGGPRFQYVLAVNKPVADFDLAAIHAENPGPSGTVIWRGGAAYVDLILHRHHGFAAPITITAEGLPNGVHASPTVLFNADRGTFVLWADDNAPVGAAPVKLIATATIDGRTIRHEVRPYTRVWADANPGSSQPMREFVVSVREQAPYFVKLQPDRIDIEAGKEFEVQIQATRRWADFKDKITVIPLSFPGPIRMSTFEIPAGSLEATLKLNIENNARPGEYTISVLAQAQVPFNKDAAAQQRPNTLVSTPSLPLTITVQETPKK